MLSKILSKIILGNHKTWLKISFYFLLFNQTQGRRKLFYSEGGWVKISPTIVGWRWKIEKKHWLKRLKAVLKNYKNIEMMDQYRNDSKFDIHYSFFENIISGIQFFCIGPHVLVNISRAFFIPDFLSESLKANEN